MLTLLIQQPELVKHLPESLPQFVGEEGVLINQLIEIIRKNTSITVGGLLESFRSQPAEPLITHFANKEHIIPQEGIEAEFLGALKQMAAEDREKTIQQLLAKATGGELMPDEKQALAALISKKKTVLS